MGHLPEDRPIGARGTISACSIVVGTMTALCADGTSGTSFLGQQLNITIHHPPAKAEDRIQATPAPGLESPTKKREMRDFASAKADSGEVEPLCSADHPQLSSPRRSV
jgi:hypothetical protein